MLEQSRNSDTNWYLVTDGVSLKISSSITLGEDADGVIAIESNDDEERWLTCAIENGELRVAHLHENFRIELPGSWSTRKPGAVLESGTVIALPHNEVFIGESAVRGEALQKVFVTSNAEASGVASMARGAQQAPPREVKAVRQRVTEEGIGIHLLPKKKAAAAEIGTGSTLQPIRAKTAHGVDASEQDSHSGATAPIIVRERRVTRRKSSRGLEILAWFLAAVALVLGVAVAANYWQYAQDRALVKAQAPAPVSAPEASPLENVQAPAETSPTPDIAPVEPESTVQADPVPAVQESNTDVTQESARAGLQDQAPAADIPAAQPPIDEAAIAARTAQELRQARALMAQGFLNWPEQNAMSILNGILERDPDNVEARNMLIDSAERLLADAQRAYADGFHDTAFVQVEKLLDVFPLYLPALDQQLEWRAEPPRD